MEGSITTNDPTDDLHEDTLDTSECSNEVHETEHHSCMGDLINLDSEIELSHHDISLGDLEAIGIIENVIIERINFLRG